MSITEFTDKNTVKKAVPPRPDDANKGTLGSLLSICGSYGMAGAAMLAGKAALRSGVGLLKCALPKSIYPIAASGLWQSVFFPLAETQSGALSADNFKLLLKEAQKSSAVLFGCGLSANPETRTLVRKMIKFCETPMVLDADALNCIADAPTILREAQAQIIVTPHPGEMGRLTEKTPAEVNSDRENTALMFAEKYRVITVLKGAGTLIASPDGRMIQNTTGNSGMATGGSGDVLAGITGSLLAQGAKPFDAAAAAVYIHGLAGDIAAEKLGKISMLPTDIIENLPQAFKSCGF